MKSYRYIKSTDTRTETSRPASQIRSLYASVVAHVTLRSLHEVFVGDVGNHVDTIVFNGVVDTINPANGRLIRPCLVTVRTTRDEFAALDLRLVDRSRA